MATFNNNEAIGEVLQMLQVMLSEVLRLFNGEMATCGGLCLLSIKTKLPSIQINSMIINPAFLGIKSKFHTYNRILFFFQIAIDHL